MGLGGYLRLPRLDAREFEPPAGHLAGRIEDEAAMRHWIKLYTEILNDPKMGRLTDRQYRLCVNLFLLAGEIDEDGELGSTEDITWRLRLDLEQCSADLAALAAVGIIIESDGAWSVRQWQARQAKPPSDQPDAIRERVTAHRERQRNESVTPLQKNVTDCNAPREEKKREEKKRKEAEESDAAAPTPSKANPTYDLALAIAGVCGMDIKVNTGQLLKEAKLLLKATPTPTPGLVQENYGSNTGWWWCHDWRGQKGEFPRPANIRETWGQWALQAPKPATVTPSRNGTGKLTPAQRVGLRALGKEVD